MNFCHSKAWLSFVIAASILRTPTASAQYEGSTAPPDEMAVGFHSITEADSQALLKVLASEDFAGRGTGQEGFLKAAHWFAGQLQTAGFQPGGPEDSWFQTIPFIRTEIDTENSGISVKDNQVVAGSEIGVSDFFGQSKLELPVIFLRASRDGFTVTDGQFAGHILVIQSASRIASSHELITKGKPECAVFVTRSSRVRSQSVSQQQQPAGTVPSLQIASVAANAVAVRCGVSETFFTDDAPTENLLISSSQLLSCSLKVERESVDVPNVIGWFPGSDETVRHEHVCIGAHLDHLGIQRGEVYPGADDNGSGSSSILQIARAIQANPIKPKRSVLMIAFCAEERGLLGSKYYAANPVRPLKDMVCMLNIDMIGRNEESDKEAASDNINTIHLVGSRKISTELHDLTIEANKHVGFVFEYDQEGVYSRSDHASFAKQGVPITFLFGGFTPHYHKPTDTLEGINYSKIANCARLNYLTAMKAAAHGHFRRNDDAVSE